MIRSASYGLPFDYAAGAPQRIEAVTLNGVASRARELLEPGKLTWLVVGDLAKIESSVRALELGNVEVWDAYGNRLR